jgi:integrase/recombinase XerD
MVDPSRVRVVEPLGSYAGGFCAELIQRGWAPSSALQQMKLMACLSRWMAAEPVAVGVLSSTRVEQFVAWRCAAGYRHFRSSRGLVPLLGYLRGLGVAPEPVGPPADGPIDLLVERYRAYLFDERGLAAGTVRYYERVAWLFLAQISTPGGELDLGRLRTREVSRFVLEQCAARGALLGEERGDGVAVAVALLASRWGHRW